MNNYGRQLFSGFIVILLLSACTEVKFTSPQPPNTSDLKTFPDNLMGQYNFVVMTEETQLTIGKNFMDGEDGKAYLSDSMRIRKWNDKYVLSLKKSKKTADAASWQVFIMEPKGCGFVKASTFIVNDQKDIEAFQGKYNAELKQNGEQRALVVDADAQTFIEIANSKAAVSLILEKID